MGEGAAKKALINCIGVWTLPGQIALASTPRPATSSAVASVTKQDTARFARTVGDVLICRAFLWSVLGMVYRPRVDYHRPPAHLV